jgi:Na+-transporting NADH:ubiquinone oxidoreductase subunit NqrB
MATVFPSLRQQDPRNFQLLYLGLFLSYGIAFLGWHRDWFQTTILWTSCLGTQYLFCRLYGKSLDALKSAMITALGLTLLLRAGSPWVYAGAGSLAIASKFLIRYRGKHLFNPANLALVVWVLLLKQAWVSPGQWGSSAILIYFIGAAGMMVLFRSSRVDTAFSFLGVLFVLEATRNCLYLGWPADYLFHRFSNGSLLLFSFFMITDPMTTPDRRAARMLWAALTALITFLLGNFMYLQNAPVPALFIMSLCTPLFDSLWKAERFQWLPRKTNQYQTI